MRNVRGTSTIVNASDIHTFSFLCIHTKVKWKRRKRTCKVGKERSYRGECACVKGWVKIFLSPRGDDSIRPPESELHELSWFLQYGMEIVMLATFGKQIIRYEHFYLIIIMSLQACWKLANYSEFVCHITMRNNLFKTLQYLTSYDNWSQSGRSL